MERSSPRVSSERSPSDGLRPPATLVKARTTSANDFDIDDFLRLFQRYEREGIIGDGDAAHIALHVARDATPTERRMLARVVSDLQSFERRELSAAQYFTRALNHARTLSGGNPHTFVRLVTMVFSTVNSYQEPVQDFARLLLGAGQHPYGYGCETVYSALAAKQGGSTEAAGFRREVTDVEADSSITHHFGALLSVGAHRGSTIGRMAQDHLDGTENPGDVHNGYFAVMLGDALTDGRISVDDAVALTTWAFTDLSAHPPFTMNFDDYTIERFLSAMREQQAEHNA